MNTWLSIRVHLLIALALVLIFTPPAARAAPTLPPEREPHAVAVQGNDVYVGLGNVLVVLDVADHTHPQQLGWIALDSQITQIVCDPHYAYVTLQSGGFVLVNIATPTQPTVIGTYAMSGSALGVAVSGHYVLIGNEVTTDAGTVAKLIILDITNPKKPQQAGTYATARGAVDITVAQKLAYLAVGTGVEIVDISRPAKPIKQRTINTGGYAASVTVNGKYAYVLSAGYTLHIGDLQIYDLTDLDKGRIGGVTGLDWANRMRVVDHTAYVIGYSQPLTSIDLTTPTAPVRLTPPPSDTAEEFYGDAIAADQTWVYVTDRQNGLRIVDVSDPAAPHTVASYAVCPDCYTYYLPMVTHTT